MDFNIRDFGLGGIDLGSLVPAPNANLGIPSFGLGLAPTLAGGLASKLAAPSDDEELMASAAKGKDGSSVGKGIAGTGLSKVAGAMPSTPVGSLAKIGAATGAGALTGGPVGAGIGGGLALLETALGGMFGGSSKPKPQIPVQPAQMGRIGGIYG